MKVVFNGRRKRVIGLTHLNVYDSSIYLTRCLKYFYFHLSTRFLQSNTTFTWHTFFFGLPDPRVVTPACAPPERHSYRAISLCTPSQTSPIRCGSSGALRWPRSPSSNWSRACPEASGATETKVRICLLTSVSRVRGNNTQRHRLENGLYNKKVI